MCDPTIVKDPKKDFCSDLQGLQKSSFQVIKFDHIEATLRFFVLHRNCPLILFALDDFQVKIFL
jgi:hypothetical protein